MDILTRNFRVVLWPDPNPDTGAILGFYAGSYSGHIFTLWRGKSGQIYLGQDPASTPNVRGPVPPLVFRPYILFSLYNHYFIGPFEKCDNKNLRNKILKKYDPM